MAEVIITKSSYNDVFEYNGLDKVIKHPNREYTKLATAWKKILKK